MAKVLHAVIVLIFLFSLVLAGKNSKRSSKKGGKSKEVHTSESCYDDIEKPYVYFSTKTSYRWNRNKNDDEITPPGCVAQQLWMLTRHGTRNPGTKDMIELQSALPLLRNEIVQNFKAGKGHLCKDDIENLEKWTLIANITEDKFLVKEGYEELEDLGDRFQDRFPKLLTKPFINSSYTFQCTDSERTDSSAKAFAKGVFGKKELPNVYIKKSSSPDLLLRFEHSCSKWQKNVHTNPEALAEKSLFEQSSEFLSMIQSVTNRLGFVASLNLSDIELLYNMCSFDKAWRPKKRSPWCAVFSEEDLKILEYREDLEYYYEDGYGFPINYEQACPPLKDVYDNFKQIVEGTSLNSKGIFYFAHSGTLLKVLARLGLFKDSLPLKHSNRHLMINREWRTSLIGPFASNLALVLFNCSDSHRVTAYVQERPVMLPGCSSKLCDFSEFTTHFGPIATTCSVNDICRI